MRKMLFLFLITFSMLAVMCPAQAALGFLKIFVARTHPSCQPGLPVTNKRFCASFKTAAICYCSSSGLPQSLCSNMTALYQRMVLVFGSMQAACQYQRDTPAQDCIAAWNCYRLGGHVKEGRCSATGRACV